MLRGARSNWDADWSRIGKVMNLTWKKVIVVVGSRSGSRLGILSLILGSTGDSNSQIPM